MFDVSKDYRVKSIKIAKEQITSGKDLAVNFDGNNKYKNTFDTRFIIFNIPAIVTCPFACKGCKDLCYAKKAELPYRADVLPSRYRNLFLSLQDDFVDKMVSILEKQVYNKRTKIYKVLATGGQIIYRIHESGDFYSQEYADKWLVIMEKFPMITFVAYTKSLEFFRGKKLPKNFVLLNSVWDDMSKEVIKESYNGKVYTALDEIKISAKKIYRKHAVKYHARKKLYAKKYDGRMTRNWTICRCSDCATCKKCFRNTDTQREIICAIH